MNGNKGRYNPISYINIESGKNPTKAIMGKKITEALKIYFLILISEDLILNEII